MDKPNVFILISTRRLGGPGKGILQFLKQVNDMEYTLCTFNMTRKGDYDFIQAAEDLGIDVITLGHADKFNLQTFRDIFKIIRDKQCNIIQTHEYKSHFAGFVTAMLLRIRWITWAHGYTHENFKMRLYNILDKTLHFFSHHAVGVSPKLKKTLDNIRFLRNTQSLILNAVDHAEIKCDDATSPDEIRSRYAQNGDMLIGIFGRLSPEKGQDIAIDALKKVIAKYAHVKLLVVGEGHKQNELEQQVRLAKLEDHVFFTPYQRNIGDYFRAIDLTLLPSRSEGLPNVVLESMVQDTPVLATQVGGVAEIIQHDTNGWICEPESTNSMADALIHILDTPEKLVTVSKICRQSIFPKFCPAKRKDKMVNLYQTLIN